MALRNTAPDEVERGLDASIGEFNEQRTNLGYLLYFLRRNKLNAAGCFFVVILGVLTLVGPLIAPYDPTAIDPLTVLQAPSRQHWFGTDLNGSDVFSRVISAPRVDLFIALSGTGLSFILGSLLGIFVAYFTKSGGVRGFLAEAVMRVADVVQAFPVFVLALALVAISGNSARNVIFAIAFLNAPVYLRLLRARGLRVRESTFVEAARCSGESTRRIVLRHLMPNSMAPAFAQVSVNFGWAVLLTAGLSFVGAGVAPPTPEWGLMISEGASSLPTGEWWPSVFPGIAIGLSVLSFALLGDVIEHMLDPEQRR